MAGSLRPEDVAGKSFKSGWRGYDAGDVKAFLRDVSGTLTSLREENERLRARLGKLGDRDLGAEFEQVTAEIGSLLQGARETAEGMRLRASIDAEQIVGEARDDAQRLRQDAWNEGTSLLEDSHAEAEALVDRAKRDSLAIISDAEREAHRIATKARKDADESVRRAKLQADQLVVDGRGRREELIREGESEAAAAQERVSVLMQRRDELLAEIESVQTRINDLRSELEERRAEIGKIKAVDTSTVRVVPGPASEDGDEEIPVPAEIWQEGEERIRIVRPPRRLKTPTAEIDAEAMAAEVRRLRTPDKPVEQTKPKVVEQTKPEVVEQVEPAEAASEAPSPEPEAVPSVDIDDLFASLRSGGSSREPEPEEPTPEPVEQQQPVEPPEPAEDREPEAAPILQTDPFELRDHLLLPISNKTLRTLKRGLTEAQNIALDELRVQELAWSPDSSALEASIDDDLTELVRRSRSAGWSGAQRLLGQDLEEAEAETETGVPHDFAAAILEGVTSALEGAGEGPRQRAAAISRVYRSWRVDEAERRVRSIAIGAYHDGLIGAFTQAGIPAVEWLVSGRGCVTCRAMAAAGPVAPGAVFSGDTKHPPAHESCACTLVPV